jgi:hypothetical protein
LTPFTFFCARHGARSATSIRSLNLLFFIAFAAKTSGPDSVFR